MQAVIAGFGFLGQRIAEKLRASGYELTVIRRSTRGPDTIGIKFVQCDLMQSPPDLPGGDFDLAVFCLAPGMRSADLYRKTYCDAQRNFLKNHQAAEYIYISSTAVYPEKTGTYAEQDGSKHSERAEVLLDAETIAVGQNACVLRLAGLYSAERPIYGSSAGAYTEDKLVHFIHRDDAAAAAQFAAERKLKGIYNIHDGNPQWRSAILQRLGLPAPQAVQGEKRLISAEKLFATGFRPQYKSYFEGVGLDPLKS